ncbi:MAG: aldo/keto reductase [Pelagimonas sp.]|uniref:aldo/keto reductase n=1 Tax=Pelagimonas sp. TaxID=2073170 RepID=UPI003D6B0B0C
MKMNKLGRTGMEVSEFCLGTMTFGTQTGLEEAHAQIDYALAAGINFMDTAEMYPVNPTSAETMGNTEIIVGEWFAKTSRRNQWVLATKHSGAGVSYARDGGMISADTIPGTIEGSLKRLKTDYIDLYQFHWPNRGSYMFRQNWGYDPLKAGMSREEVITQMEDCLGALQKEVDRGTIRAFGLSNESAWGTAQWLAAAERVGGPRVASIQNEYSLVCRLADTDLAELMMFEDVGLLPFSPLGAGFLSGKYQGGAVPDGSRMSINAEMGGRKTDRIFDAVEAYLQVAKDFDLDPVHMAFAWSARRPFVASSIFGATTLAQLEHALGAVNVDLTPELLAALDAKHKRHPMPY